MRISTSLFYDRGADSMSRLSTQADKLMTQLSTNKRISTASDDSAAWSQLAAIKRDVADAGADKANLGVAASVLQQADTTLSAMTAQVQRAAELAVRVRNGSNDATARGAIADELDAIRDQLMALGNTSDPRGQPLFGGADGAAAVTRTSTGYTFASTSPAAIPTGNGQSVQPSEKASRIFALGSGDLLSAIDTLSAALRTGGTGLDGAVSTGIDQLNAAATNVTAVQASLGARASRVELEQNQLTQADTDREAARSALQDTDISATITELQKTMTVLQATQASFTKLQGMSLFDYLR